MPPFAHRVINIQAVDGDQDSGPVSTILVTFDRACTVLRDADGNSVRILNIPQGYPEYQRLEDCTALGIERVEIVGAPIVNLQFMRNIMVSLLGVGT